MTDQEDSLDHTACDDQDGTGPTDAEGKVNVTVHKDQANIPMGVEFYSAVEAEDNNLYLGKIDPNGFLGTSTSRFVEGMRILSINGLSCLGLDGKDASMILECIQGDVTLVAVDPLQNDLGSPNPIVERDTLVEHDQVTDLALQAAEEGASPNQTLVAPTTPTSDNAESSPPVNNTRNSSNGLNHQPWETNLGDESIPNGQGAELVETPKDGDGSIRGCLRDWHCKLTIIYICGWVYLIVFLKNKAKYGTSCDDYTTGDDLYPTGEDDCPHFWVELRFLAVSLGTVRKSALVLVDLH